MCTLSEWFCNDNIPEELQWYGDVECYDKVMDQYPNYPMIWYRQIDSTLNKKLQNLFKCNWKLKFPRNNNQDCYLSN